MIKDVIPEEEYKKINKDTNKIKLLQDLEITFKNQKCQFLWKEIDKTIKVNYNNIEAFSITSLYRGSLNFYFRPPCFKNKIFNLTKEYILKTSDKLNINDTYEKNNHLSVELKSNDDINILLELIFHKKLIFLSNEIIYPDEIEDKDLLEGAKKQIIVNAYERSSKARKECIEEYGYKCTICKFDFEKVYGEIGKDFIHVHHIKPLSEIDKEYKINPIQDLRPVCPNCHAMLHKKIPAYSIEEIRNFIDKIDL